MNFWWTLQEVTKVMLVGGQRFLWLRSCHGKNSEPDQKILRSLENLFTPLSLNFFFCSRRTVASVLYYPQDYCANQMK